MSITLKEVGYRNIEEARRHLKCEICEISPHSEIKGRVVCSTDKGLCPIDGDKHCDTKCFRKCRLNRRTQNG